LFFNNNKNTKNFHLPKGVPFSCGCKQAALDKCCRTKSYTTQTGRDPIGTLMGKTAFEQRVTCPLRKKYVSATLTYRSFIRKRLHMIHRHPALKINAPLLDAT
jgi:hypothetical protein